MTDLSQKAARGAAASLAGQWLRLLIQLCSIAVLARLLQPSDFGIVTMVTAIAGFAALLSDFGLSLAAMQAKTLTDQQRTNLFWMNVVVGVAASSAVVALAAPIGSLYDDPTLVPVVQLLAWTFTLQAAAAQYRAEAARQMRYVPLVALEVLAQLIGAIVALGLAATLTSYWALVAQQLAAAAALLIGAPFIVRWRPGLPRRSPGTIAFLRFGTNTAAVQMLNYLTGNIDSVLLGRYWGAATVGVYNQAFQLLRLPLQQLAAPLTRVALPMLSRISDSDLFTRRVGQLQSLLTYALGGLMAVGAALADPALTIFLGAGWDEAATIFRILAVGGIFQAFGYVYYWVFLAKSMTGIQLRYSVISRIVMVGLIFGGLTWGAIGVATAVTLGLALNWLVLTVFALPRTGVNRGQVVRKIVAPGVLYVCMYMSVELASVLMQGKVNDLTHLLTSIVVMSAVLVGAVLFVPIYRRDLRMLLRTVGKVRLA